MPPKDKYADPKLRDEIKKEIHDGDKGGEPGQWSARKAQMMAAEYKRRGGSYNTDPSEKDESQKNLSKWGDEDWQTKEGSGEAKKEDGSRKRYLPKKAWEEMSPEEREETDQKKQKGSKEGKQHVGNTPKAKQERKKAGKKDEQEADADENEDGQGDNDEGEEQENDDKEEDDDDEEEEAPATENKAGQKRKSRRQANSAAKKQKSESESKSKPDSKSKSSKGTVGSKHMKDEEPGPRGSADRLPKKGQKITWKAMPGFVEGKVKEVLTKGKKVDGKDVKASKEDPKIVMASDSSGKICVHKPDACFYD